MAPADPIQPSGGAVRVAGTGGSVIRRPAASSRLEVLSHQSADPFRLAYIRRPELDHRRLEIKDGRPVDGVKPGNFERTSVDGHDPACR